MLNIVLGLLEAILVLVCSLFVLILKGLRLVIGVVAKVVEVVSIVALYVITICYIEGLPIFWQSAVLKLIIFGGALTFICFIK